MQGILPAWGRILTGYTPAMSIEITRECPLRCPGCYAYGDDHLGGELTLREVRDFKGQELIDGILALVDRHKPLHLSIVGGEPLVRYRELNTLLPLLSKRGLHVQVVTSAVREIPAEWHTIPRVSLVVSIDGLQPEHDVRRTPATYDRILKHIAGHSITVHCTVTRQQVNRAGLHRRVPAHLVGAAGGRENLGQPLYPADRRSVQRTAAPRRSRTRRRGPDGAPPEFSEAGVAEGTDRGLRQSARQPRRVHLRQDDLDHLRRSDDADYAVPVWRRARLQQCGCIASAGLAAVARHKLFGFVPVGSIFAGSLKVGRAGAPDAAGRAERRLML